MENSTITFITDQLKALTSIPSPSGFTKEVAQYLVSTLEEMGFTPERSRKGNVCVTIGGEGIAIGNSLILSLSFPPLRTVRESFELIRRSPV